LWVYQWAAGLLIFDVLLLVCQMLSLAWSYSKHVAHLCTPPSVGRPLLRKTQTVVMPCILQVLQALQQGGA
jgi:hypothetical protein